LITYQVLVNWVELTHGPAGLTGIPVPESISLFGRQLLHFPDMKSFYYLGLFLFVIAVAVSQRFARSRVGIALHAIRNDELAAEVAGICTTRYQLLAFVLSAAYAAVAGSYFAHFMTVLSPDTFAYTESANVLIMAVAGGLGSTYGTALAAAILVIAPEYLRALAQWRMIVYGLVLLLIILFFPRGLAGLGKKAERWIVATWARFQRRASPEIGTQREEELL
jgi:branched-chain amino acid transport system permease protein